MKVNTALRFTAMHRKIIYGLIFLCLAAGVLFFSMPTFCLWKLIWGIPCPGCGLTRAVLHLSRFRFNEAFKQNILLLPILLVTLTGGICFFTAKVFHANCWQKYNEAMQSKCTYTVTIMLAVLSWVYNIYIGN